MLKFPLPGPVNLSGLCNRLVLTGIATLQFAVGLLVSLPFAGLAAVGLLLVPIGVGVLGLRGLIPVMEAWSSWQRQTLERMLGRRIYQSYRAPRESGVRAVLATWGNDSARWKDLAHAAFSATVGLVLSGLVPASLIAPIVHVVLVSTGIWPPGLLLVVTLPVLIAWWLATPVIVRARLNADALLLDEQRSQALERRVSEVTKSRAETIDHATAELRRIERNLHDGAQARLVSLGMKLGLAEEIVSQDPQTTKQLIAEARAATESTLTDIRTIVRGIFPPVLADRGLSHAIEALVLDLPLPVELQIHLPAHTPASVESAVYFAVSECLTNVVKHAVASKAFVTIQHEAGGLQIDVKDDGRGGAEVRKGGGLDGLTKRLAAFDGTVEVESSPDGGSQIKMELPCV
ncbi:MAG TPA: sensor domain-containing protein [Candidatus Yaniella excrementigallinarum]|nr:sensor domain-containing protein [Candidatus Yaniella excrementigallinarum]